MLSIVFIGLETEETNTIQETKKKVSGRLKSWDLETFFNSLYLQRLEEESAISNFKVTNKSISFTTRGEIDFVDLTHKIQDEVTVSGVNNGLAHIFAPHATGILILTENDDALLEDIRALLEELAPKQKAHQHPSNSHSHLRSILLPPDKTLPVINGKVVFGTWQSLLFVETDVYPRKRTVIIQVMGEQ